MMCIVHYISALRRLKESKKTVMMLGGEREAPPMIRAQRDMIRLEMEYYRDEVASFFLLSCIVLAIVLPALVIYMRYYNV